MLYRGILYLPTAKLLHGKDGLILYHSEGRLARVLGGEVQDPIVFICMILENPEKFRDFIGINSIQYPIVIEDFEVLTGDTDASK